MIAEDLKQTGFVQALFRHCSYELELLLLVTSITMTTTISMNTVSPIMVIITLLSTTTIITSTAVLANATRLLLLLLRV